MRRLGSALIISCALLSCMPLSPYRAQNGRAFKNTDTELFVLNTLAETVSVIHPDTLTIHNDAFLTGTAPNALHYDKGILYIVNSLDNTITKIDDETFSPLGEYYLGKGRNPWTLVPETNTSAAYVPNFISGTVTRIDLSTGTILAEIAVGKGPEGAAIIGNALYVCNANWEYETSAFKEGSVSVIDAASDRVIKTISVQTNPQAAIAFPALNELHIICTGKNSFGENGGAVCVIDAATYTVKYTIAIGGTPGAYAYDATTDIVYLAGHGSVRAYRASTGTILPVVLSGNAFYSSVAVDERYLYVCNFTAASVIVLDRVTHAPVTNLNASDGAQLLFLMKKR